VAQGDSMFGQSGSGAWKVRAGKGGKYRLARNLGMCNYKHDDSTGIEKLENCHLLVDDHQKLKISLSTFSRGRYTTVRLRSCISPFRQRF
jgi:hypothetical protein